MEKKTVIIGAGLTGLCIAYLLQKRGINCQIIEANNRVGGRILTSNHTDKAPVEMGATWIHAVPEWLNFLKEIGVKLFPQDMGNKAWVDHHNQKVSIDIPKQEPMYRVEGGTTQITKKLVDLLPKGTITLNSKLTHIKQTYHQITLETEHQTIIADQIISTLPPKLMVNTINCTPALDATYLEIASTCGTWMEYSIKFALRFKDKFWDQLPYTMFSQTGIIQEMYDHSSHDDKYYALKGFLNPRVLDWTEEERKKAVINELRSVYKEHFPSSYDYMDKIWLDDHLVSNRSYEISSPKQNNGNPILSNPRWNDTLFFAGTETSKNYPGYMEGAFFSAVKTVSKIFIE